MLVPYLLIVNGLPGSGKTTLAQQLAQDLAVPRFARDGIYETLYDAMHRPTDEAHPALGHGAFAMMYYASRHGGHAVQAWLEANRELLLQGELTPLSVGGSLIEVDTTTPERMNYETLLSQIRTKMTVTGL